MSEVTLDIHYTLFNSDNTNTVGPRYNGNGYKGYPNITVILFRPNCIINNIYNFTSFILLLYKGDPNITVRFLGPTGTVKLRFISIWENVNRLQFQGLAKP